MKQCGDLRKQKEYMKMMLANMINRFGDSIDCIALTWLIFQLTGDASWSALLFGINRIPTIFFMPFTGAFVERANKKRIMIWMDIIRGVCVGVIASALLLDQLNVWILVVMTLLISSAEAFRIPASTAIIPQILRKEYYETGLSLNSSLSSVIELIGTAAAGVLIALLGIGGVIYIDMATFFLSALIICNIYSNEGVRKQEKFRMADYMKQLNEGITYLSGNKVLKYFAVGSVFLNGILVPFNSLQAPLASEVLNSGETMLSVIGTTFMIGMIIGSTIYPWAVKVGGKKNLYRAGMISIAMYYFSFVCEAQWIHSRAGMYLCVGIVSLVVGVFVAIINCLVNVEIMSHIDKAYLARVSALLSSAGVAIIPIVSFVLGGAAERFSIPVIFTVAAIIDMIVCVILGAKKRISVMDVNKGANFSNEDGYIEAC